MRSPEFTEFDPTHLIRSGAYSTITDCSLHANAREESKKGLVEASVLPDGLRLL